MSTLTYAFTFDNVPGSATVGKITGEITTPVGTNSADVWIEIIYNEDTDNILVKEVDLTGDPDVECTTADTDFPWTGVNIPKDSNGKYLAGTYTFNISIKEESVGSPPEVHVGTEVESSDFEYMPVDNPASPNAPAISASVDCFLAKLTITESTNLDGIDLSSHSLVITPPTLPGVLLPSANTEAYSLAYSLPYTNVTYGATASGAGTRETVDGPFTFIEEISYLAYLAIPITCNSSLCGLIDCAKQKLDSLITASGACGGFAKLSPTDQQTYITISAKLSLLAASMNCSACNDTSTLAEELKTALGGTCVCEDSDQPTPLRSLCGTAVVDSTLEVEADYAFDPWVKKLYVHVPGSSQLTLTVDETTLEEDVWYDIITDAADLSVTVQLFNAGTKIYVPNSDTPVRDVLIAGNGRARFIVKNDCIFFERIGKVVQDVTTSGTLEMDTDICYWTASSGTPVLTVVIADMIQNKEYLIVHLGSTVRAVTSGLTNILKQPAALAASVAINPLVPFTRLIARGSVIYMS